MTERLALALLALLLCGCPSTDGGFTQADDDDQVEDDDVEDDAR